ncbi:uncharacterized protein Z518_09992 [Rhinocladiella mackenziei CBS 650.93]|uniref:RecQ-mediated genome instability protein 1 n=1 Tax=Rhinocladiella mackenziei CBS 650.93 TaxID=1442369 RepID=A0A0D2FG04_9EURO|nr:uncharacterized protein Z518_09992 [Rhinocladiella mackenziei CBS 650.93]KIX00927.1 hypothetical protein Z518_09992 [Rhinocladiella mackenziei CBS 650.93]
MTPLHPLHDQVSSTLQTRHHLPVNVQWLSSSLSSRGQNLTPLPALVSTAHFRILASDITASLLPRSAADAFPENVADVNIKERRLEGTVIVQVLDVIDVGSSKWSQVEAIERIERGEEVRGREVIRTVDVMTDDEDGDANTGAATRQTGTNPNSTASHTSTSTNAHTNASNKLSSGPHKLLVQDARGTKALAFELVKIPRLALSIAASASVPVSQNQTPTPATSSMSVDSGMSIGCKLLLHPGTVVRRGMVMLRPEDCVVMGGKVEAWDKKWKEMRKQRLIALVNEENATNASDGGQGQEG